MTTTAFFFWLLWTLVPFKTIVPLGIGDDGSGAEGTAYDPRKYTSGDFLQGEEGPCPATGRGGDAILNILKNRDLPAPLYRTVALRSLMFSDSSVDSILSSRYTSGYRKTWETPALRNINRYESRGVSVEGYFVAAIKERREACNCNSDTYVDFHTWLTDVRPDDSTLTALRPLRRNSIVAEISPRLLGSDRHQHPNYNQSVINVLARERRRVRVYGWLMWDQEHRYEVGRTRATLWEIHPIHKIDVRVDDRWKDLDSLEVGTLRH